MNVKVETLITLKQVDNQTGKVVSSTKPQKNLLMDGGLNALAQSTNPTNPAAMTAACRVGSGNTSDKIASGAITFTQTGTTITASAGFFTAGMVGYIFKYGSGTGGAEYYITAYTDSTHATVDTTATVGTPTVATVWNITRSVLETLLYSSATYETSGSGCGTTDISTGKIYKRTYNFPTQAASYNVNEVGYYSTITETTIYGRIVLAATEVVAPTNFLQVVITTTFTYTPSAITAVTDVGTNINTDGNLMIEALWGVSGVNTNGSTSSPSGYSMDGSASCFVKGIISNYTQNTAIGSAVTTSTMLDFAQPSWVYASVRGKMTLATNTTISTAAQTLYGVCIAFNSTQFLADVKFTTTFTCPTGSFLPRVTWSITYNRALSN